MMRRRLFLAEENCASLKLHSGRTSGSRSRYGFAAIICSIVIISSILTGCASDPVPAAAPDDVWTLLARGEGDKARPFFLGEVDVNATDGQGRTPLHYAAENKDPVLASFFIARGAKIDALDRENRTPLAISTEKLDPPTARVLASAKANIHHSMGSNASPARTAVRENGDFLSALFTSTQQL